MDRRYDADIGRSNLVSNVIAGIRRAGMQIRHRRLGTNLNVEMIIA